MDYATIDFRPDWTELWTAEHANFQLEGFRFDGPGWYFGASFTLLVIPFKRPLPNTWDHKSKVGEEKFYFHYYDNRNPATIFNGIMNAPNRKNCR